MRLPQIPSEIIDKVLSDMQAEAHELVRQPPDTLRSEFGFGRANGILISIARFKELLDFEIAEWVRKREMEDDDNL